MGSTLQDLKKAKEYIELCINLKPFEKLYRAKPKILRMLNLDNSDEAFNG
jgi:hypothetical protein